MKTINTNLRAFVTSFTSGIILLSLFLFFWKRYEIPSVYQENIFFGLGLFSIILIVVLVYQSNKIIDSARVVARGMTRNMLEESHELYSALYRNSPIPYLVINASGYIDSMNIAAARFFHVELDALEGIDFFSLLHADKDDQRSGLISGYFHTNKPVHEIETRIRRPDGVEPWVLLSLFPFRDAHRNYLGLLTLVDITKQKKIDKAKTEFVSLASHQLRTPISALKWNVELLTTAYNEQSTRLQSSYLDNIVRNVSRMEMLVNDFLNVSKLELGTLVPEYTHIDIVSFLKSVYDEYSALISSKNIQIVDNLTHVEYSLLSDAHLLHMIVSNVVGNALKYTPQNGEVRIEFLVEGDSVIFVITDTGIGIPKEEQDLLFSKLFRASNAKKEAIEGTGLGLYVVREALHILGGEIACESEVGKGTSFTIRIPQ